MNVPLLLIHGDRDNRTPVREIREFNIALKAAGKNVEYIELPNEGHGFRYLKTQATAYQAIFDFLWKVAPIE